MRLGVILAVCLMVQVSSEISQLWLHLGSVRFISYLSMTCLCSPYRLSCAHIQQYFASGMGQNGEENEGIRGFLICDILSEVKRSRRGKLPVCISCKKKGASVGCAVKSCRQVGHYPCLKELGGFVFQCYDRFETFCPRHRPKQRVLSSSSLPIHSDAHTCCICLSRIECEPSFKELYCPSCKTFLHRDCLQVR